MIPDSDIENIATQSSTAQICVDNLVDAALVAGGHDNVTVLVVDLVDDGVMREAKRVRRRNITIATVLGIAFVLAAAIWAYAGITGSYYLGTYKDTVAVYRAFPASRSALSCTGSTARPPSNCPTCPKTHKIALRQVFSRRASTTHRTPSPSTAIRSTRSRPVR